jgi:hypothetical protein
MRLERTISTWPLAAIAMAAALFAADAAAQSSRTRIVQTGDDNAAAVAQLGAGNDAGIVQVGRDNLAVTRQAGDANTLVVDQRGRANAATIAQNGSENGACLLQRGRNLSGEIVQDGGERTTILQTASGAREIHARGLLRRCGMADG